MSGPLLTIGLRRFESNPRPSTTFPALARDHSGDFSDVPLLTAGCFLNTALSDWHRSLTYEPDVKETHRRSLSSSKISVMADSKNLSDVVAEYAVKYGHQASEKTKGLEAYAVHLFAQEDGLDAVLDGELTWDTDLSELILPGDDLGVDGVLIDEAGKRIVLIQCTWRATLEKMENKLNEFSGVVDRLLNPDYVKHGGEAAQQLLGSLPDRIKDGYSVELRFVTNMAIGNKERLTAIADASNNAFDESGRKINLELYGRAELEQLGEDLKNVTELNALPVVQFSIQKDKTIIWTVQEGAPRNSLVGLIKGNELAALNKEFGLRLFTANIRLPLATRKVNPRIRKTAEEEPDDFFYYNNGVSAVCSEFAIDGTTVTAKGFQIINGAQTVDALKKTLGKKPNGKVYVLFRMTDADTTSGSDKTFAQNVIRFNNTQNPVKVSDFFANDPIQTWLSKTLDSMSGKEPMPSFFYLHKAGHKPSQAKGRKALKIDVLAGLRHAFLYGPVLSYKAPALLFDQEDLYAQAFGVGGDLKESWDDETLAETAAAIAINSEIQAIARGVQSTQRDLKKSGSTTELIEAKYLFRLSRYVAALVAVGLRAIIPTQLPDFRSLMASQKSFDRYVTPLIEQARVLVENEMLQLEESGAVQPEYNFARDESAWRRLEKLIESAALTKIKFGK